MGPPLFYEVVEVFVKLHGFSLLRRSSFSYEGRAAVASWNSSAESAEAYPPSPRLRRIPAPHSSTG